MTHTPIFLRNISLSFPHKTCFRDFSTEIHSGQRIALIGRNGSGKSSLLKIIQGEYEISEGSLIIPKGIVFGHIPQIIHDTRDMSGAERFNKKLSYVLSLCPDVLLLDEPTNHLDAHNRASLMRMLICYSGTLIIASHDVDLLQQVTHIFWHIDEQRIHIFKGKYDDYLSEVVIKRNKIEEELTRLDAQKKSSHHALMQEQKRAANSKKHGKKQSDQNKWPGMVSGAKAHQAGETAGKKKGKIEQKKQEVLHQLAALQLPELITPKFALSAVSRKKNLVSVIEGSVGYDKTILTDIYFSVEKDEHVAIRGKNASGKSTFIKAIFGESGVIRTGEWSVPDAKDIGYLDQHYHMSTTGVTLFEALQHVVPHWTQIQMREHLNDFLFRKNEEVHAKLDSLSGGEKARFCLAKIAAHPPHLLILDEVTNNLDRETRAHVICVLKEYPGAFIVISHDNDFLAQIHIDSFYDIKDNKLVRE